jgi:Protein RETICULATA-related
VLQDNSLGWGSFMAVSSNTRYQIVNTIEERLMVRCRHFSVIR